MLTLGITIVITYALACTALYVFQERMVYLPSAALDDTPQRHGWAFEDRYIETSDGVRLHAWWLPLEEDAPVALFLHGNAGNISHRMGVLADLRALGLSVLIPDYRGYGLSTGRPSEEGTYRDAEAAYRLLSETMGIDPGRIVIFGRSLGGGVASWLAHSRPCAGLVLESTFTSVADMARRHYPIFPARWLARIRYDTASRIPGLRCPLLIVHSAGDEIVPYSHAQVLLGLAPEPKRLIRLEGGHNDAFHLSRKTYLQGLEAFLREVLEARPAIGDRAR